MKILQASSLVKTNQINIAANGDFKLTLMNLQIIGNRNIKAVTRQNGLEVEGDNKIFRGIN
ncbi:MAG: hypothetical protein EOP41_03325 [Sphingobacteriaceae bacterium]|nr:MAG: hypothetical protein EOP41_03325 [Sphingobacteriaceae bacterium]